MKSLIQEWWGWYRYILVPVIFMLSGISGLTYFSPSGPNFPWALWGLTLIAIMGTISGLAIALTYGDKP